MEPRSINMTIYTLDHTKSYGRSNIIVDWTFAKNLKKVKVQFLITG